MPSLPAALATASSPWGSAIRVNPVGDNTSGTGSRLAEDCGRGIDLGHISQDPRAELKSAEPADVALEAELVLGATVDVVEDAGGETPLGDPAEVPDVSRSRQPTGYRVELDGAELHHGSDGLDHAHGCRLRGAAVRRSLGGAHARLSAHSIVSPEGTMSDTPQGPGWWQASDNKWYPPDTAPGAPPPSYGPPASGGQSGGTSRTVWIVLLSILGVLVLACGGCGLVVFFSAREVANEVEELADELELDFTSGVPATGPASCTVTDVNSSGTYDVEVRITNESGIDSHYRIAYDLSGPDDLFLGTDVSIIGSVPAGDEVRDTNLAFLGGETAPSDITCTITEALRIPS